MSKIIAWAQRPENGPLLHIVASLFAALLSAGVGYATDSSNPLKLDVPTLGLLGTLGNAAVSWLRNYGMKTVTAGEIVPNGDTVIVPTAGREPPVRQPATEPEPPAPQG